MTLTTWLLVFGGFSVTAIVIDGVRRMLASHAALKIEIDETLCDLPIEKYGSELPNGGARIAVADDADTNLVLIEDGGHEIGCSDELDDLLEPLEIVALVESVEVVETLETLETLDTPHAIEVVAENIAQLESINLVAETPEPVDQEEVLTVAEIDTYTEVEVTADNEFSLDPTPVTLTADEIHDLTQMSDQIGALTFDPTRPVHEMVESHSMVQNDLFADQDLSTLAVQSNEVKHDLVESSDDILFSDNGMDFDGDDLAVSGAQYLSQHSQDETLTSKLAKVTSMNFGKKLLSRKRAAEKEANELAQAQTEQKTHQTPGVEQVISVLVSSNDDQGFYGSQLRQLVEACGLEHGDMNIFHRFEDGPKTGSAQFSMANMMEPGTFDLLNMDHVHTPGVVFFLGLPTTQDSMQAFDYMLETAQCLATNLGGEVLDEQRSVMRPQTIEHCRQQVREFERRHMTRRAQL